VTMDLWLSVRKIAALATFSIPRFADHALLIVSNARIARHAPNVTVSTNSGKANVTSCVNTFMANALNAHLPNARNV
jgi:hypothetical protein